MSLLRGGKPGAAVAASALLLAWLAANGQPAASHSGLDRTEPAAGAILAAAPERVDAWFASALRDNGRNALTVSDPLGERVDDGSPRRDGDDPTHLWTGVRPGLPSGVYRVDWRSSAEDGHPAEGSFEFTVDPSAAADGAGLGAGGEVLIAAVGGGGVALAALLLVMRARRREA